MPDLQLLFRFHFSSLALLTCTVCDMGVIQEKLHILTYNKSGLFFSGIITTIALFFGMESLCHKPSHLYIRNFGSFVTC